MASPELPSAAAPANRFSFYLPLLALPAVYFVLAFVFLVARGPYWFYYNLDPDYFYLLNSVTIAEGSAPDCVVHPGTPVQTIGSLVLRVTHLFIGTGTLREDVFARPEFYLGLLHAVLLLVISSLLFWAGDIARRATDALIPALLLQAAPIFSFTLLESLAAFKPEPLLVGLSVLFGALVLAETCAPLVVPTVAPPDRLLQITSAKALGIVAGLALAVKLTFMPFIALPLFFLHTLKDRLWYGAFFFGAFVLGLLPALKHWKWIYKNIAHIATHKGVYGAGERGLLDWALLPQQLLDLLKAEPHFAVLLAVSVLFGVARELKPPADAQARRAVRLLNWLTLFEIGHLLLTAKHPMVRYLLPSYALLGCNLGLLYIGLGGLSKSQNTSRTPARSLLALTSAGTLACMIIWNAGREALRAETAAKLELYHSVESEASDGTLIFGVVASAPSNALFSANALYSRHRFSELIAKKYPRIIFYDIQLRSFVRKEKPLSMPEFLQELRSRPHKLLGDTEWTPLTLRDTCILKEVRHLKDEGLYEVSVRTDSSGTPLVSP